MSQQRGWAEEYLQPCGTVAAYRRHHRRGEEPCFPCAAAEARRREARRGVSPLRSLIPDPRQVRNGLPEFRPYVYRGSGADAYTGEVVEL